MITYAVLVLGLAAIVIAWHAGRKNKELRERIAQVNSRVYNLRREMQESREQAQQDLMKLKFELLKLRSDLQVTGEMSIGEIMAIHPQAQQVLAGFHIGGCASCVVDDSQSLAEVALLNGRELDPILMALNTLVAESSNGQASAAQLKTANVQLQF